VSLSGQTDQSDQSDRPQPQGKIPEMGVKDEAGGPVTAGAPAAGNVGMLLAFPPTERDWELLEFE